MADPNPAAVCREQYTIEKDSTGISAASIAAPWVRRCNPSEVIVHDPYLCIVRHSADIFPCSETLGCDELEDLVRTTGLVECTFLLHFGQCLASLHEMAPRLRRVTLHTRGLLRADTPAGDLLEEWLFALRMLWAPKGLNIHLIVDARLHTRRCILQGLHIAVEIAIEWGIAFHSDHAADVCLPPLQRKFKRTDLIIIEHTGRAGASDDCLSAGAAPLGADEWQLTLDGRGWNDATASLLEIDLQEFQRRHHVSVRLVQTRPHAHRCRG